MKTSQPLPFAALTCRGKTGAMTQANQLENGYKYEELWLCVYIYIYLYIDIDILTSKQTQWGTNCYYPLISVASKKKFWPPAAGASGKCTWQRASGASLWDPLRSGLRGFTMATAPRPSQAEGVIVVVGNHLNSDTPQVVASSVHPKCADIPSHGQ